MSEKQDDLSLLQRELAYETDMRRRADIQNRIAELQKTIGEKTRRYERDNERKRLQGQLEALTEEETNAKTSAETMWEQRLTDARLYGEAEKLIIGRHQEEILTLLRTYGDGWRDIGATFGQRLVEGMGAYPAELRRMVTAALTDIRAAADGTIARLRQVATAAQVTVVPGAGAATMPGHVAGTGTGTGAARQPWRIPERTIVDQIQARFAHLLQPTARPTVAGLRQAERVTPQRETVVGAVRGQPSFTVAGPMVNIQNMTVRRDEDIQAVSRALHRQLQSTTRARGGR